MLSSLALFTLSLLTAFVGYYASYVFVIGGALKSKTVFMVVAENFYLLSIILLSFLPLGSLILTIGFLF